MPFPSPSSDRIMAESQLVFEDVVEDYHAISFILGRFQRWKFRHGESYREAYISLCLPKLLGPLVRLQLLDWNPLEVQKIVRVLYSLLLCCSSSTFNQAL